VTFYCMWKDLQFELTHKCARLQQLFLFSNMCVQGAGFMYESTLRVLI